VVREAGSDVVPSPWLPSDHQRSIQYLVRAGSEHSVALGAVREAIVQAFEHNSNL
jgi:hypothetical protein